MTYSCTRDDSSVVQMTIVDPNTTIEKEVEKYNAFMDHKIVSYVLNS